MMGGITMFVIRLSSLLLLLAIVLFIGCGPSTEVIALSVKDMD